MDKTNNISLSEKKKLFFLTAVPGIGNRTIAKLFEVFRSAEEIYDAGEKELRTILNERQAAAFIGKRQLFDLEKEYERMTDKGISFLSIFDVEYPQRLKNIPDAPYGIFFQGALPEDEILSVAVIGARDCSEYGKYVAEKLGKAIALAGINLISGMARGIDGIGQNAAMVSGGRSFAVLGNGVDICYPASNRKIYENLKQTGGILSVYAPGTPARAQNFPPRNRIVSGLADAVVVVEGRVNSGTLITVDMALEQGKEVYVVPGRITDRLSDGCNRLLKQGAGVFLSPESFLSEIEELYQNKKRREKAICAKSNKNKAQREEALFLDKEEEMVFQALDYMPQSMDVIFQKVNKAIPQDRLTVILMKLIMNGLASQKSQGQFALCGFEEILKR